MKKRKIMKHVVYDYMHKTVVTGLMGLTVATGLFLGFQAYQFVFHVKPQLNEAERLLAEEKVLHETYLIEAEYYRKKREREAQGT